ncbi:MAG: hypothetical protein BroJett030_25650 [Alphaproteobacteria bacterium]|nr:MAG: hypothetical protein BroJett030_25650 [Alphaproteobacteria bacterium]
MTAWVVDADVALKWHLQHPDSGRAEEVLRLAGLHAPELQHLEVRNILGKYVRMGLIGESAARRSASSHRKMISYWHDDGALVEPAFEISLRSRHPFYDCLYLALALRLNGRVVTADKAFVARFAQGEHAGRVLLLSEFAV